MFGISRGTRWRFKSKYGALHGIGDLSAAEHVLHSEGHFDRCKRLRRRLRRSQTTAQFSLLFGWSFGATQDSAPYRSTNGCAQAQPPLRRSRQPETGHS